ncbi:FHF complex subunit HOOK-interacting protein 2B-like isoform X2 [Oncorhynchus nerka]|uniref:FHF complex subunit HOOK-interacting protein 2B-like isoform X2 n=1 Tax=Oncorhynchus nerka TaxID=8023 RepID=UPI0031B835D0
MPIARSLNVAPSLPLQEDFVYHWKAITHYYIETSDDKDPVTDTNIPSHLELMLDILTQEESERDSGETGPCMEYLLHHKILETVYTLGKADCPPGMKQQVLSFYTKLLGRIRQPLLPHINVHRPVLHRPHDPAGGGDPTGGVLQGAGCHCLCQVPHICLQLTLTQLPRPGRQGKTGPSGGNGKEQDQQTTDYLPTGHPYIGFVPRTYCKQDTFHQMSRGSTTEKVFCPCSTQYSTEQYDWPPGKALESSSQGEEADGCRREGTSSGRFDLG